MKTLIALFAALCATASALAQEPAAIEVKKAPAKELAAAPAACCASTEDWDFLTVAFCPDTPPTANSVDTYGVRLGLPVSFGDKCKVVGAELGLFASTTKYVKGFQGALLWSKAEKVSGLQANPIVNIAKDVDGVQAGLINVASGKSFQFGLVNYIENSSVPFFPIVNFKF
jgi:hypothetical protein